MQARNKKINIGISIAPAQTGTIWDSGLNQNLAFMVLLLRQVEEVGEVFLINAGDLDQLPPSLHFDTLDVRLVKPEQVTHEVNLVIEMGGTLPLEWLRHVRALGARIVTLYVGHTYTGQAEGPMFQHVSGPTFTSTPWHEMWTLPQHMKTSGPLLRTLGRVPVHEMPHIWSPIFLQRHIDETAQHGHQFGFRAQPRRAWRVAIFEPNISVVKNCFIPMLACDQAYRQDRSSISQMMVMNTVFMKEHLTFNRFATHLDLTRDGKATYEPRLAFVECMASFQVDAVVSHQWECGLNYGYYDALYGGYPLIHNSEFLRAAGMGFYYPGFEAIQGANALLEAQKQDLGFWQDYKASAARYLRKLDPADTANVQAYRHRVLAAMEGCHD